jgi:hypothetical protein
MPGVDKMEQRTLMIMMFEERSVLMWLYISRGLLTMEIVLFSFYVFWSPLSVFAQIIDKGEHVQVVKGTGLCSIPPWSE